MGFLRRLFSRSDREARPSAAPDEPGAEILEPEPPEVPPLEPLPTCPYCGYVLDPPPARRRRCPSCRQPIVVRHADGRSVYLVESAVPIFDRERQRLVDEATWTVERERWLALAASVHAPAARRERLAAADLSAEVVEACRSLYLSSVEPAFRAARQAKRWPEVARIRRHEAAALFAEAGSPVPAPGPIVALQREAMLAELRALRVDYTAAELVSVRCCRACRADDGKVFKIALELRDPRLPHSSCPKGLCACQWWLAMPVPKKRRRTGGSRATSTADPSAPSPGDETTIDQPVDVEYLPDA